MPSGVIFGCAVIRIGEWYTDPAASTANPAYGMIEALAPGPPSPVAEISWQKLPFAADPAGNRLVDGD